MSEIRLQRLQRDAVDEKLIAELDRLKAVAERSERMWKALRFYIDGDARFAPVLRMMDLLWPES